MRFCLRPLNLNIDVQVAVNVITKVHITHMKIKRKRSKNYDYNNNNNSSSATKSKNKKITGVENSKCKVQQKAVESKKGNMMAIEPSTYHTRTSNCTKTTTTTTTTTTNSNNVKKKITKIHNNNNNSSGKGSDGYKTNKSELNFVAAEVKSADTNRMLFVSCHNNSNNSNKINTTEKMICDSSNSNKNSNLHITNCLRKSLVAVDHRPSRPPSWQHRIATAMENFLTLERMPLLLLANTLCVLLLAFCCQQVQCNTANSFDDFARATFAAEAARAITASTSVPPPIVTSEPTAATPTHTTTTTIIMGNFTIELITNECKRHCELEQNLFQDEFGIKCTRDDNSHEQCYRQRCNKGCELWWHALQEFESCQEACSVSVFYPYDLPCISACEMGQHLHAYLQRLALTPLVAAIKPQLLTAAQTKAQTQNDMPMRAEDQADQQANADSSADVIVVAATAEVVDVGVVSTSAVEGGDNGEGGVDDDGSLMGNSLRLKWSIKLPDNYFASRPFNIQYQLVPTAPPNATVESSLDHQQWQYLADYNCNEQFDCKILDGLMPYTSYRFRFELVFGEAADELLHSPPTEVYRTPAFGTPTSMPNITNAFVMDHQHIAVFWSDGQFTNGPLKGYKLFLSMHEMPNKTVEKFVPADRQQYVFTDLEANTEYTLNIAMVNTEGDGPNATVSLRTKELVKSSITLGELQNVLLANENNIRLLNLETSESQPLYESEVALTDYALHGALKRLYVTDALGTLKSFQVNNVSETSLITFDERAFGFKPHKLTLDWLNQRLYMTGILSNNTWTLASCDLQGNGFQLLSVNFNDAIMQLDVDPLNGWLFYTTAHSAQPKSTETEPDNSAYNLWRYNLADDSQLLVINASQIGYFINDYQRFMLLVYNRSDGDLHEYTYDGVHHRRMPLIVSQLLQGNEGDGLQAFSYQAGVLLATYGTQLAYENQHTGESEIWPLDKLMWCQRFWLLQQPHQQQPQPKPPAAALEQLQALLSAHVARISWSSPQRNEYQTTRAWSQWEYELEIMDVASNSAFNIRNIRTNFFNVEKLQANTLYKLRVRAITGGEGETQTSDWSNELNARTWPLGEHKLWWTGKTGGENKGDGEGLDVLFETNELGAQGKRVSTLPDDVRNFVQLNGTLFYLTASQRDEMGGYLRCVNIMNPELNCTFNAPTALSMAYDWRAGKIYWADRLRDCVLRAALDEAPQSDIEGAEQEQYELLPIFGVQQLAIDAERGLMYYSTGRRLLRRTLSGIHETSEVEYFHVNGMGGHIRAFALALEQQQLYWIVRQTKGHVRLFASSLEPSTRSQVQQPPLIDRLLSTDVADASLVYLSDVESLMWLQRNTNRAVLLRTDTLSQQMVMTVPSLRWISAVQLKTDYAPQRDGSVIPMAMNESSVNIVDGGYWDDFLLRWTPIATAENHTVFYKVLLQYSAGNQQRRLYTTETLESQIRITEFHQPQLLLNVSITPHTYWQAGVTMHKQLRTPAAAPTQPKRLRIFIERVQTPLQRREEAQQARALIRWEPPENISQSTPVVYKIYCWRGEELFAELLHNQSVSEQALEAHVAQLQLDETYTFQVQAFVGGRASGGEKTAFHALHVDPEQQSVPRLLLTTAEHIAELDMDLQITHVLVHTSSEADQLAVVRGEQRLLWVNENVELMSYVPGANAAPVKLARMRAEVLALTVDWVTRIVYWAEMATDVPQAVALYQLDLCQFEGRVMLGTKLYTTTPGRRLKDLTVLPYAQLLLWLEASVDERYATLMARNLSDMSPMATTTSALKTEDGLARLFEGAVGIEGAETVLLLDYRGKLCIYNVYRQHCQALKLHFGVSATELQDLQRDASFYYALHNGTVHAYNQRTLQHAYTMNVYGIHRIRSYNSQPYPTRECLLPSEEQVLEPKLTLVQENYFLLRLPQLQTVGGSDVCWLPLAGLKYKLTLIDALNHTRHFTVSAGIQREVNVTMLEPFSNYTLLLSAHAYYQQKLGQPALNSAKSVLRTAVGVPTMPQNFTAHALSPTEIEVSWKPPTRLNCAQVWYELHWQTANSTGGAHKSLEPTNYTLNGLMSGQMYTIWLKVFCSTEKYNTTASVTATTFAAPEPLELLERGAYNLSLTWQPSGPLEQAVLVCQSAEGNEFEQYTLDINELQAVNISAALIVVSDLTPKTRYEFFMRLSYANVSRPYQWPEPPHARIAFDTLGDRPSSPGKPHVEHITGEIFKVFWEPARNNGAPILEYQLEALQQHIIKRMRRDNTYTLDGVANNKTLGHLLSQLAWVEEPKPIEDEWIVYCNTTLLNCIVRDVHTLRLSMFRVRARNEPYGWGPYSQDSERVNEPYVSAEKRDSLILAIIAPAAIVSSFVIVLVIVRLVHQRRLRAKKLLEQSRPSIWSNLSTQQQQQLMLSRHRAFSLASNSTAYGMGPLSDADIALLPHINWSQITLVNFLGSGAFGEVYEGCVKWDDEEIPEKVAIKCLRKGANEFSELLQEAQLMSNFQHENIVRLIGVCFETEAISIIMEHMEGGDLLTYLRESRPILSRAQSTLQLLDLLTMCIDVATGCAYLEDMHFVHRDLACRNCLVSSRDPAKRVVKIGDFGLARDIYKNDYYRKEGEGLLPVRWMSPESLVDGVFTTQSDVWAFGVLCWEIFTLGQQPYAARNNFEVLTYVKDSGRLEQPENCPDKLFELWLECWQDDPDHRPSFRKCRNIMVSIKADIRRISLLPHVNELDGGDYHIYANHNNVVLTSFLANPLPKVSEEDEDEDIVKVAVLSDATNVDNHKGSPSSSVCSATSLNKPEYKVHFEISDAKDCDFENATDNSQLITHIRHLGNRKLSRERNKNDPQYYVNEGISRL